MAARTTNPDDPWAFDPNDPYNGLDPSAIDNSMMPPDVPSAGDAPAGRTAVQAAAAENQDPVDGGSGSGTASGAGPGTTDPNAGAPNVPAPGNDANAVYGYYSQFLGRSATDAEVQGWLASGKSLGEIQNAIANSPEADAYAKANGLGKYAPANAGASAGGSGGGGATRAPAGLTGNPTLDAWLQAMMDRLTGMSNGSSVSQIDPTMRAQIMSAVGSMIDQGSQPIGDVSTSQQARAYQVASQRNAEQNRSAAAERRAQSGMLFSGPMETDINAVEQQRSEKQAAFEAQLTTTLLQDKQQKLAKALDVGVGLMSADQQAALQEKLQGVNAELAKSALQLQLSNSILQNNRFYDDLGYRIGSTQAGLNGQAASSLV